MLFSSSYYEQAHCDSLLFKIFSIYWLFLILIWYFACPYQTLDSSLYLCVYTPGKGSVNKKTGTERDHVSFNIGIVDHMWNTSGAELPDLQL